MRYVPRRMGDDRVHEHASVARRVRELADGYSALEGHALRRTSLELMARSPDFVAHGELVVTFCQAFQAPPGTDVVLVLTDVAIYVLDEHKRSLIERLALADTRCRSFKKDFIHEFKFTLSTANGLRTYKAPRPSREGVRIAVACGHPDPHIRDLMPDDPVGAPMAVCGPLTLYPDRLVDGTLRHLPLDGSVKATVDTAGNIAVTRGRDLGAKAAGTLLLGPLGLLVFGNARERVTDTRELYLLVEGRGWVLSQPFTPESGVAVRDFVGAIRVAVGALGGPPEPERVAPQNGDVGALSNLIEMRAAGQLTDEEFSAAKARLLGL